MSPATPGRSTEREPVSVSIPPVYSRKPVELTTSLGRVALGGASPTAAQAPPRDSSFWAPRTRGPRRADSARWVARAGKPRNRTRSASTQLVSGVGCASRERGPNRPRHGTRSEATTSRGCDSCSNLRPPAESVGGSGRFARDWGRRGVGALVQPGLAGFAEVHRQVRKRDLDTPGVEGLFDPPTVLAAD